MPTLHLTNWSSRKLHGPGRIYTIMAKPRSWEHGDGQVWDLTPTAFNVGLMAAALADRSNVEAMAAYRTSMEAGFAVAALRPWEGNGVPWEYLSAMTPDGHATNVADGDTLCCACSRAEAAAGRCHRAWAAPFLARAGWTVILDGVEVAGA